MDHCIAKILEIVGRPEIDDRALFQLGYNLGRLSEITGLGREQFWDRWKDAISEGDRGRLQLLARELLGLIQHLNRPNPDVVASHPGE